ncbi:uncharacterized protein LOC115687373 [Syzygium oleosum]|uniref:uncharacterized protein LOC115687373 n=1 Tax=Syzygium oleosum TaxID=219896 RepID=UPI0024BB7295|nr:uncharacterized protein LOC115687373 [Syzygium oleosum]
MAVSLRAGGNGVLSRLKALFHLPRLNHVLAGGELQAQEQSEASSDGAAHLVEIDMSTWKTYDARSCGVTGHLIPKSPWTVLALLRDAGFNAYLVGGCVRDLILKRIPKDFDVITTANLQQVKEKFHRCDIVGRRFPICRVRIKGSVVEVSSFKTIAKRAEGKEKVIFSCMPSGCNKRDFILWRDSMHRDFTINSLFFDPSENKIYDYTNAMEDVRSLKLRTIIPAQLSFEEDCARILRGVRIAARLGLALSRDIEIAIGGLLSSITRLNKHRLMLEINSMLSYGAAEPSLCLLQRLRLLEIILPFHAAYLDQQTRGHSAQSSLMLMRLFFNLDKLVSCDQPSDCTLWIGLLAFHLALVNNPQDALVIWAFASTLYYGKWKGASQFANKCAKLQVNFVPEISGSSSYKSALAESVSNLASLVQESVSILSDTDRLIESMTRYPHSSCSGLVLIQVQVANNVRAIFQVLVNDVESYNDGRGCFEINHELLGKGFLRETRHVLGKIILNTMNGGVVQGEEAVEGKKLMDTVGCQQETVVSKQNEGSSLSHLIAQEVFKDDNKSSQPVSSSELLEVVDEQQKLDGGRCSSFEQKVVAKERRGGLTYKSKVTVEECQEFVKAFQSSSREVNVMKGERLRINEILMDMKGRPKQRVKSVKRRSSKISASKNQLEITEKCESTAEDVNKQENVLIVERGLKEAKRRKRKILVEEESSRPLLSEIFK